ncbi:UDP-2,3-diacylglucosamine hydrolase [Sulfurifustis variabilis]|uniref:UDP-2,3-diacylglucosamine hydrolase n=1 Tax=Sulfurifustis variabilis TaxID=1675686 RepID=A0A1B4V1D5_9GAMM|nr:UDP-2,3-diacylglucosamine diphosphatase [Sulfurifustis variabilis]BAU47308.1 UDP-2,3-diacylglucosamine hydrolase [Sulfurifustis variabilis]
MATLFISDLHLTAARPEITALFLDFLAREARGADALYILGDLFEYWIGDEAVDAPEYRPMIAGLRGLTDAGVPLYVMHGNRDFLMGPAFERATGCRLLPDPARIDLYGTAVLLTHGDALCTRDEEYMTFRAVVRDPEWQRGFLTKSVAEREAIARNYRELSRQSTAAKRPEIMDVTPAAVTELLRARGVRDLIHGHTHRPAEHVFELDGAPARRVVLGDWYDQGSVLRCTPDGWSLATLTRVEARQRRMGRT